jgi:hypothetical protein
MTTGWKTYQRFLRLEQRCRDQGFKIASPKHKYERDFIALQPADPDSLPVFTRDVDIFVGNLDEVEKWLSGYEYAKLYLKMIKAVTDHKIDRCEQKIRNDLLVTHLKQK